MSEVRGGGTGRTGEGVGWGSCRAPVMAPPASLSLCAGRLRGEPAGRCVQEVHPACQVRWGAPKPGTGTLGGGGEEPWALPLTGRPPFCPPGVFRAPFISCALWPSTKMLPPSFPQKNWRRSPPTPKSRLRPVPLSPPHPHPRRSLPGEIRPQNDVDGERQQLHAHRGGIRRRHDGKPQHEAEGKWCAGGAPQVRVKIQILVTDAPRGQIYSMTAFEMFFLQIVEKKVV